MSTRLPGATTAAALVIALALTPTAMAQQKPAVQELPESSIELHQPNGGEQWQVGSTQTLVWKLTATTYVDSIEVHLLGMTPGPAKKGGPIRKLMTYYYDNAAGWTPSDGQTECVGYTEKGSQFVNQDGRIVPVLATMFFSCSLVDVKPENEMLLVEILAYSGDSVIASDASDEPFAIVKKAASPGK